MLLHADLLLLNGRVYTMDKRLPMAEAVAVRAGRILAVGDDAQIRAWAGPDTEQLDLQGRAVVPAFTDAHIHLVNYGLSLTQVPLDGIPSLEQVLAHIAEYASGIKPGQWIRGWGWNRNLWPGAHFPNKGDLDSVTMGNPAFLRSKDGHAAWVNSRALELAGLTSTTPDPPGGELQRDPATGELTGVLKEDPAIDLVKNTAGPVPLQDMEKAIGEASQRLHRLGIVSVHVPEEEHELAALQSVWQKGSLRLRVNMMIPERNLENVLRIGLRSGLGDTFLRLYAVKVYADGSLGTRTADLFDPYDDEPGNRGIEVTDSERLDRIVAASTAGGWPVAVHALGDRANSRVLDALEQYWREWSKLGLRPRIEHVQLIAPQDLPRLAAMGVIASMQPIHATSDMEMAERHWGKRCSGAYAWRSLLDSGAVLAFGSDAPVEDPSVIKGIFAAVTRQREDGTPGEGWYPEQRLTVPEAVYAYTMGAAYASGEERIKGSLAVGKLADMVVLSQDIFDMLPQQILHTRVQATILDGKLVFTNL
jgi:predicted amidohydrolase YtcJ